MPIRNRLYLSTALWSRCSVQPQVIIPLAGCQTYTYIAVIGGNKIPDFTEASLRMADGTTVRRSQDDRTELLWQDTTFNGVGDQLLILISQSKFGQYSGTMYLNGSAAD